jgi:hypothetical protein
MYFLVDLNNKIIIGWSAKCGCSHIKIIFWFLHNNNENNTIHTDLDYGNLPDDIENYRTIIISRNPYKRIVSGFLDKYNQNGQYRKYWNNNINITFTNFINELIENKWSIIDEHHFTPQTKERFDRKIFNSKSIKFYDIENIDYKYIENLYNKKIPETIIYKKYGHERNTQIKENKVINDFVYDLNIDDSIDQDCIQKRKIYDSDFDRTTYPINDREIIYF